MKPWWKDFGPLHIARTVVWDGRHPEYYAYIVKWRDRWEFDFTHIAFSTPMRPELCDQFHKGAWEERFSFRCSCRSWTLGCNKHRLCGVCQTCATYYTIQDNALAFLQELDRRGKAGRVTP